MTTLVWGMKESFRDYIQSMDGTIAATAPACFLEGIQYFPAAGPAETDSNGVVRRFKGTVTFVAHGGLLRLEIRDPRIVTADGNSRVLIGDETDTTEIGLIENFILNSPCPVRLTPGGARLLQGYYPAGTELDPLEVRTDGCTID